MNRLTARRAMFAGSVPHGCGDEPDLALVVYDDLECSPRVWG